VTGTSQRSGADVFLARGDLRERASLRAAADKSPDEGSLDDEFDKDEDKGW
jgi:hypothetical protein